MDKLLLFTLPLLALTAACVTTDGLEAELQAARTPVARGRILYERSCARCHSLYMPKSFAAEEWSFYVRKYGRRARLKKQQQTLVYAYLSQHARD